jgi:REP element-mobilizing transposase RayT
MTPYDPAQHHRRSIRWRGYDYASAGAYFVTICIHHRLPLLGSIRDAVLVPSPAGRMVTRAWHTLPERWPHFALDTYVIMPNHIHAVVWLHSNHAPSSPDSADYATGIGAALPDAPPAGTTPASLGRIVQVFKNSTTRAYAVGVRDHGWCRYRDHLWQPGYHDRIVRNLAELGAIREYVRLNPTNWAQDPHHVP